MTHSTTRMTDEEFAAWNERMAHTYDPEQYHESGNPIVRWIERRRVARLLKLLAPRLEHRVLEVGVGAGNILEQVRSKKRAGIDLSQFLLTKAARRLGPDVQLMHGDAERLREHVDARSFERVFCSEVLEHVRHPEKVLQGIADVLTDDGIAVVSVPNEHVINRLKSILKAMGLFRLLFPGMADHMEDEWHVHVFGKAMLLDLCSKAFFVERIDAVPFSFLPIRLVARLRPKPKVEHAHHSLDGRLATLLREDVQPVDWHGRTPVFLSADRARTLRAEHVESGENSWKDFFKRWPRFYDALVYLIGPTFLTGLTSPKFIRRFPGDARILNAGSGVRSCGPQCFNVDILPFPGVDVVADLAVLPFRDGSFDGVTCDQVLEHVPKPATVVAELVRVTKPGGLIHIAVPFLFPWHPSPSDYSRWTQQGLADLFAACDVVETGNTAGPCSALTACLSAILATLLCFGSKTLQGVLQYVFLVLLFPLKFLDIIFARLPGAELCAANVYVVVRKRS